MNKQHPTNQGSSSILVIILLVVLMIFGLAVLTTSLSNIRLAEKKQSWMADYYRLERQAQLEIGRIDQLAIQAFLGAQDQIDASSYLTRFGFSEIPDANTLHHIRTILYQELLTDSLKSHIEEDTEAVVYSHPVTLYDLLNHEDLPVTEVSFTVNDTTHSSKSHIRVTMNLLYPTIDNLDADGGLLERYAITEHVQWQEPFVYEGGIDFGDPFEDIPEGTDGNPFSE